MSRFGLFSESSDFPTDADIQACFPPEVCSQIQSARARDIAVIEACFVEFADGGRWLARLGNDYDPIVLVTDEQVKLGGLRVRRIVTVHERNDILHQQALGWLRAQELVETEFEPEQW